jgi:hypothetical protein
VFFEIFFQIIVLRGRAVTSKELIADKVTKLSYRDRIFSPDITIYGLLSQAIGADQSMQAAVSQISAHMISNGYDAPSANTSAYSQAVSRLPGDILKDLAKESAQALEDAALLDWNFRGRSVKIIDGTTISMPDTTVNQESYPQPKSQKKGVGFPLARLVAIFSLATGALLDAAIGPYEGKGTGEHALLRQILNSFEAGDIVLGDAYYGSYFLIATLMAMKVDVVFPQHGGRNSDFRKGKRLGKDDHLVELIKPQRPDWMSEELYARFADKISIREVKVNYLCEGFRDKTQILITTLVNEMDFSKEDLLEIYSKRWFVELDFNSLKTDMGLNILRSKSPAMVIKEIWACFLAYNLIRKIMAQSAAVHNTHPRKMSFKLAMQMIYAFRQSGLLCENSANYLILLKSLVSKEVGNRPGRSEPRMVKRRPKPFKRLQKNRKHYKPEA